ncbi:MAG TPA: hypothetical protein PLN21_03825 [Gemmatales bacterium]|nr:hypothetical protein [Gemmatales bacterium]
MRTNFKPTLDLLEDRTVPAVTLTFSANGYAVFTGDSSKDWVKIDASLDGDRLLTAQWNGKNGVTKTAVLDLDETPIAGAVVNLKGGDDIFIFRNLDDGFAVEQSFGLWVDMGNGNDRVIVAQNQNIEGEGTVATLNIQGGSGRDNINVQFAGNLLGGATLTGTIDGGAHDDNILVAQSGIVDGTVALNIFGSHGNDTIRSSFFATNPEDEDFFGSVRVNVDGGSGYNSLTLLASADEGAVVDAALNIYASSRDGVYFTPGVGIHGPVKASNWHPFAFHNFVTIPSVI